MSDWIKWIARVAALSAVLAGATASAEPATWNGDGWYWIENTGPQKGSETLEGPFSTQDVCLGNLAATPYEGVHCIYFATKDDFDR